MDQQPKGARLWLTRIGWLVLYWAGGVAALGALSYAIKYVMRLAQLAS